jgi:hypothetical protein
MLLHFQPEMEIKESVHNKTAKGNHFLFMKYHQDRDSPQNIALSHRSIGASHDYSGKK